MQQVFFAGKLKALCAFLFGAISFFIWDQFAHWIFESIGLDVWYNDRFLYDPGVPPCGIINFLLIVCLAFYAFRTGKKLLLIALIVPMIFSVIVLYISRY